MVDSVYDQETIDPFARDARTGPRDVGAVRAGRSKCGARKGSAESRAQEGREEAGAEADNSVGRDKLTSGTLHPAEFFQHEYVLGDTKELSDAQQIIWDIRSQPDSHSMDAVREAQELIAAYWVRFWSSPQGRVFHRHLGEKSWPTIEALGIPVSICEGRPPRPGDAPAC